MNWIDYAIIGVIALSALMGLMRGFVKEALSLLMLAGAFLIARRFYPQLSLHLPQIQDSAVRDGVSIAILFVLSLIVGAILNNLISQLVNKAGLASTNMLLGLLFGALRGVVIIAIVLFVIDAFTHLSKTGDWSKSQLIPHFSGVIQWFFAYLEQSSSFLPNMP